MLKKQKNLIAIGLVLTSISPSPYIYANTIMPLTYVSNKAIENNPDVQQAWHSFKASIYGVNAASAGYLPSVDASASLGYEKRNYGVEDEYNKNTAELTVTQMLYDGFETSNSVVRFKRIQLIRYFELLSQTEQTALEASVAFLDIQKFTELVALAEANLKEHESVYQQIEQSVRAGVARAADLEQISGRLSLAQSNVLTEYANLHDVNARYLRVVGEMPHQQMRKVSLDEDNIPITIEQALNIAYLNNPGFFASLYNIEAQEANAQSQKSAFHPNVDLSARYGTQDRSELGLNETLTEGRIGLNLSYNLYNGGRDSANLSQAYQEVNVAKYQRDQACVDIRQNLQITYNNIAILERKLPALDQHRTSSSRVKVAYKDQFEIGQRTLLDVLDAENESFQANRSYITALYERKSAILTMLSEMGKLLPTLKVMSKKYPSLQDLTDDPIVHNAEHLCPKYDIATTLKRKAFLEKKAIDPIPAAPVPVKKISTPLDDDKDGVPNDLDSCPSTPASTSVDLSGCTIYNNDTSNVEIGIPFASDSSDVRAEYIPEVSKLADFLKENPNKSIEIQGHSSLDGNKVYNRKLSEQRALSVAQILIQQFKIEPSRVTAFGYGTEQPNINEISPRANAINRRIEIVITNN